MHDLLICLGLERRYLNWADGLMAGSIPMHRTAWFMTQPEFRKKEQS